MYKLETNNVTDANEVGNDNGETGTIDTRKGNMPIKV
jgi:hypothetical protein